MKAKEIRDMPDDELAEEIAKLRKDLFGKRFANATVERERVARVAHS
jgi:ribosomal protein L29